MYWRKGIPGNWRAVRNATAVSLLVLQAQASAQFFDPGNSLIMNMLRQISVQHNLGLQEQRLQTAHMVEQLRTFYDTYSLLRRDIEFSQSLYNDMTNIGNLDLTNTYAIRDMIINGDRVNYWFPTTSTDINQSAMDAQALIGNAAELHRIYESFALSVDSEQIPNDMEQRRQNALKGEEYFSKALIEQAIRSQMLAKTYDSLAVELNSQARDPNSRFTEAERTQFMIEAVKLKELSNSHYEKYLKLSQDAYDSELKHFKDKAGMINGRLDWQALKSRVNSKSKIRYGFFDISSARTE